MHSPVIRGFRRFSRPDSGQALRSETVSRIARLELRARGVVEGVLAGLHKSPFKGQSVEFLQHRPYVRGDDLRRVDWKVWARQDRLSVKEYEEETSLRLTLLVDGSASMDYRPTETSRPTKYQQAATLAASLAWLALSHGDAAGGGVFDDQLRANVPARNRRTQLAELCAALETPRNAGETDFGGVLRRAAEQLPRRGVVVVVSDLLGDRDGLLEGLRLLRQRGHDLAILQVMDDDELDFPFEGPTRFEGLELPNHLACNPRGLRAGYLEALEAFLADVRRQAAGVKADYELIRTSDPPELPLVRFLARRMRLAV
jgi:uncharacterized protein (DUF58 family)